MSKIKKFITNPNLFFYDYFRKKIGIKKDNKNNLNTESFKISNFQNYIDDITDYKYKGKIYIHNKEKFLYLLYRLSLSKCTIRIV